MTATEARLGDLLVAIEAGKSPRCDTRRAVGSEYGVLKVSAMTYGTFLADENKALLPGAAFRPKHRVQPGDLLLSRANTLAYVGGVVRVPGNFEGNLLLSDKSLRLVCDRQVDPDWLLWALRAPNSRAQIEAMATGTKDSMWNVSQASLRRVKLQVPPLPEQRRRLNAAAPYLDYAATIEVAEAAVVARIKAAAGESLRVLFENVCGTDAVLGDVATWSSGGTPSSKVAEYYGGDIPWVVSGDLKDCPLGEVSGRLSSEGLASSSARWVEPGAVLVAMYGATIGRLAVTTQRVTTNQAVAAARTIEGVLPAYLFWYIRSQRGLLRKAGQGAAQPNISQALLKAWPIPVPDRSEQTNVVARASEVHDATQRLLPGSLLLRARAQALRSSVLRDVVASQTGSGM